jgi:hypothetical protein
VSREAHANMTLLALPATSEVVPGALFVKCNDDKYRLNAAWIGSKGSSVFSPHLRNRAPGRVAVNHKRVCISRAFDRKFDRNADKLQQTIMDVGKRDPALQATGRTATHSHGQSRSYPPFGMPKISFESHHNSSEATKGLRLFCL